MSFLIKAKNEKVAKEILQHLLKKYSEEIEAYDLVKEKYDLSNLSPELKVEVRKVSRRGGSLSFTIPPSLANYLNINAGDFIALILNEKIGVVYLKRVTGIETM